MFREEGFRPSDQRGFLHKSFIGRAVGGIVKRVIPVAGIASDVISTVRTLTRPTVSRTDTARPTLAGAQEKEIGRSFKFGGNGAQDFRVGGEFGIRRGLHGNGRVPCEQGWVWSDVTQSCVFAGSPLGAQEGGVPILGQHGAGMVAGSRIVDVATCNKGMVLGDDGICYNKRQISNKERMWPAGRRPLLTGGDMRAISIASRAGTRLEGATKRLQKLGMMKKPTRRALPTGHVARLEHASQH